MPRRYQCLACNRLLHSFETSCPRATSDHVDGEMETTASVMASRAAARQFRHKATRRRQSLSGPFHSTARAAPLRGQDEQIGDASRVACSEASHVRSLRWAFGPRLQFRALSSIGGGGVGHLPANQWAVQRLLYLAPRSKRWVHSIFGLF